MNDTAGRYHHGCTRVIRLLTAGLERHGAQIIHRVPAHTRWQDDDEFSAALEAADMIVINGEGTLHHGKPAAETLLQIATHPERKGKRLALVNALYQDNPTDWDRYLRHFDLIAARDSESAAALTQASGQHVRWLPDLSLSAPADIAPAAPRAGQLVGDSVRLSARQVLADAARRLPAATYLPTKTLRHPIWRNAIAKNLLYRVYNGRLFRRPARFEMARTEADYLTALTRASLHITGRFHAVCLSMLTETPFLALASNASKIERLLTDAGLPRTRMISPDDLEDPPVRMDFRPAELDAIRAFRSLAQARAEALFADLARLGRHDV